MNVISTPWPIVDTHAHLDDEAFDVDRPDVIANARQAGVAHIINIGYRPESWQSSLALREDLGGLSFALGLHPQLADNFTDDLAQRLLHAIQDYGPVAIGETGFDFFRKGPSFQDQERAFRAQIALAIETQLPLIIHQRDSGDALMNELDRWPSLASIVLHSFEGNSRLTEWALERGCYVGVGGLATRAGSQALRNLLERFPLQRVLLETDSPYLAPPMAASRRNTPAQLPTIAAMLGPIWNVTVEELCCQTTRNAAQLFGLGLT